MLNLKIVIDSLRNSDNVSISTTERKMAYPDNMNHSYLDGVSEDVENAQAELQEIANVKDDFRVYIERIAAGSDLLWDTDDLIARVNEAVDESMHEEIKRINEVIHG